MSKVVIVGGGTTGLSLAARLVAAGVNDLLVLEADPQPGGKCVTIARDGFLIEGGPNGFLDSKPYTMTLLKDIDLENLILRSNDAARKRFIYSGGRLHVLAEDPAAFLKSDLISWGGKIRLGMEFFIPARREKGEESLADFCRRRLGSEALDKLIDPMASGVYAGNPEEMSLQACFPKVDALERKYGGLLKGMLALQKEAKKAGQEGPGAGPGGILHSFKKGTRQFIDALVEKTGSDRVASGRPVTKVEPDKEGYQVTVKGGDKFKTQALVLACPACDSARMVESFDRDLADELSRISYCKAAVVGLGYRRNEIDNPLDGFGYLIPASEKRRILGTLFTSSIFTNRAPKDHVLLRTIVGGARRPDLVDLPEKDIVALVREELKDILGIKADPVTSVVVAWQQAIPQYRVGHIARLEKIETLRKPHTGLWLTGNSYRGIGMNDCTADSERLAPQIASFVQKKS